MPPPRDNAIKVSYMSLLTSVVRASCPMRVWRLPSECGASCLLNAASCLLNVGRVFFGASFLWGELSFGRVVRNPSRLPLA